MTSFHADTLYIKIRVHRLVGAWIFCTSPRTEETASSQDTFASPRAVTPNVSPNEEEM